MKRKLISLLALALLLCTMLASCGTFNFEKKDMTKYLKDFSKGRVEGLQVTATLPDHKKIVDDPVDADIAAALLKNKFIADDLADLNGWTDNATLEKGDGAYMYYIAVSASGSKDYNFYFDRETGKLVLPQLPIEEEEGEGEGEGEESKPTNAGKRPVYFILGEGKFSDKLEAKLLETLVKPGDTKFVDVSANSETPVVITAAHTIYVTYSAVYKNKTDSENNPQSYAAVGTSRLNLADKADYTDMDDDLETYLRNAMGENSDVTIVEGEETTVTLNVKTKKDSDETEEINFTFKVEYVTEEKVLSYTVDEKKSTTSTATEKVTYYFIVAQVQDYTVPELNAETVKNILKFETAETEDEKVVAAYKASVAAPYEEKYEAAKKANANSALWSALLSSIEVKKYPSSYVNGYVKEQINNAKAYYYNDGYTVTTNSGTASLTPEQLQATYPKFLDFLRVMLGKSEAEVPKMKDAKAVLKEEAQAQAKKLMLLYGLADLAGVSIDRTTDAEYLKLCQDGGVNQYYSLAESFENLGLTDYAEDYYAMAELYEEYYYEQLLLERSLSAFYETKKSNQTLTFKESSN